MSADLPASLWDSEIIYHNCLRDICTKYGCKYTKELQTKNYGKTDREICNNVVTELKLQVTVDQVERELEAMLSSRLPKAPLRGGVERLLKHLHDTGIPIALCTNSTRTAVRLHEKAKPHIFDMFHHKVCATDPGVDRGKPFPDIYLFAVSRFPDKPKPAKCLVFEDSNVGVEAAHAAGMQIVLTPMPAARPTPEAVKRATIVLKSLMDFRPEIFGLPPFADNRPDFHNKRPKISAIM